MLGQYLVQYLKAMAGWFLQGFCMTVGYFIAAHAIMPWIMKKIF